MGLLDDAIRDNLDLKRRRGADPTEIEAAEQEALGPVRRDPFEHAPDEFESVPGPDDGPPAYDQQQGPYDDAAYEEFGVEEEWEEEFEDRPIGPDAPHATAGEAPEPSEGDLTEPTRLMDHQALEETHPPLTDTPSAPPPDTGAGDETMQYDVEEALASESAHAEPTPDWAESSDKWDEPPREPAEPPPADKEPRFEPPPDDKGPRFEPPPAEPQERPYDSESDVAEPPAEPDAPEQAKSEDDVLEETPEFLVDTPDHDRLWFEQRPPRDFDFDD